MTTGVACDWRKNPRTAADWQGKSSKAATVIGQKNVTRLLFGQANPRKAADWPGKSSKAASVIGQKNVTSLLIGQLNIAIGCTLIKVNSNSWRASQDQDQELKLFNLACKRCDWLENKEDAFDWPGYPSKASNW